MRYRFLDCTLDAKRRELRRAGELVPLRPRVFELLLHLVEHRSRAVSKPELFERIWPQRVVSDATLNSCIKELRKAVGDTGELQQVVQTLHGHGFRFVAELQRAPGEERRTAASAGARQRADGRPMLVVLPIDNLSGNAELDFMSDGFTEAIISEIGSLNPGRLGVIARTSSMTYKGTKKTIREVAGELDVQYLLEGSLRHCGDRLMITTQLIRAADQAHLWAKNYERPLRDILQVQSEVAAAVANEISIRLTVQPQPSASIPTVDPVVYELYLKGRYFWNQRTEAGLRQALVYYEQAIAIDPQFARAHCGVASCWTFRSLYGSYALRDTLPKAKAAALHAIELDSQLSEAHSALGLTLAWLEFDWLQGERELRRGIEVEPNSSVAHHWYAVFLSLLMRHEEALQQVRIALHLDPLSPTSRMVHAVILDLAGHYYSAIEEEEKVLAMSPRHYITRVLLGGGLCKVGRWDEAIRHLHLAYEHSGFQPDGLAHVGAAYAAAGMREEALDVLDQLGKVTSRCSPYYVARIHAGLGNIDMAMSLLEQAYEERFLLLASISNDFFLQPLIHDPRFQAIIAKMNLPSSLRAAKAT